MFKKSIAICAAAALILGLAGCREKVPEPAETETVAQTVPETEPETTAAVIVAQPEQEEPCSSAQLTAFRMALEQFAQTHTLPDGTDFGFDPSFGLMENNEFAICDVDGDGAEELVITFTTAPVAGMCQWIYGFDAETDGLYEKLSVFPGTAFYTGGLISAGWSHNQGLGGERLWPYTLMGYNPAARVYEVICHVDSWDASRGVDWEGNSYPTEKDPDGVGTVFLVTMNGETEIMSLADYEAWHADLFGSAAPIEPVFQKLTADNIRSVCPD